MNSPGMSTFRELLSELSLVAPLMLFSAENDSLCPSTSSFTTAATVRDSQSVPVVTDTRIIPSRPAITSTGSESNTSSPSSTRSIRTP